MNTTTISAISVKVTGKLENPNTSALDRTKELLKSLAVDDANAILRDTERLPGHTAIDRSFGQALSRINSTYRVRTLLGDKEWLELNAIYREVLRATFIAATTA